jgi:uncharacterized membrane protein
MLEMAIVITHLSCKRLSYATGAKRYICVRCSVVLKNSECYIIVSPFMWAQLKFQSSADHCGHLLLMPKG